MALYHYKLGFPDVVLPTDPLQLVYGNHARHAASGDRYGTIKLPESVHIHTCQIIEMEVYYPRVVKLLLRLPYDEINDLCIVVLLKGNFVKTVWLNRKTDWHQTLDKGKYQLP